MAAKKFKQVTLRPGRYHIGDGKFMELGADRLKQYADGTKAMLKAGLAVPMILEHPEKGSPDGSPRDKKAKDVKHGAGWITDVAQGTDGSMTLVLEATDADVAKKLSDGSIRFTSPELRNQYIDGKGRVFKDVISHVALTHKPRNPDQSKLEPIDAEPEVAQFSLDDYVPAQFSNDDEDGDNDGIPNEGGKEGDDTRQPEGEENPYDPPEGDNKVGQLMKGIIHALADPAYGVIIPDDDCEVEQFLDRLSVCLNSNIAAKQNAEAKVDEEKEETENEVTEETPPMQFSLSDVKSGKATNKLLAKVISTQHDRDAARLDQLIEKGQAAPVLRDLLMATADTVQFSMDGEELPSFTRSQIIDMLADCPPAEAVEGQFSVAEHPEGASFYAANGNEMADKLDAILDKLAEQQPKLIKARA